MRRRHFVAGLGAMLIPLSAAAQRTRVARVAFIVQSPAPWLVDPLLAALQPYGWVRGKNLELDVHNSERDAQRVEGVVRKLVEQGTDVIVVVGTHFARAAQRVTKTVPIVMLLSGFPVEGGLVQSFARPGGNITGLATYSGEAFFTKHVSLIRELVPSLSEFGVLWDYLPPAFLEKEIEFGMHALRSAATELNVKARVHTVANQDELARALAEFEQARVQAIFATSGPVHGGPGPGATRIVDFTRRRKLPLVCDIAGSLFNAGGLLAYSASWREAAERCASFVERLLRGAKAAELPIERPTRFELVLNLKTAKAVGITVPPAMLARADRVIQ